MKRKRPALKQPTSDELLAGLVEFVRSRFYQGEPGDFAKDRRRLLDWVILFPAQWLNERGVTVPADRYREILTGILMDALRFGNTLKIGYRPAWLAKVVQSHFAMHGDEIYEEAKSMRNLVDHAMVIAGKAVAPQADPVVELLLARKLVRASKGHPKTGIKRPEKAQLTLL